METSAVAAAPQYQSEQYQARFEADKYRQQFLQEMITEAEAKTKGLREDAANGVECDESF